MTPTVDLDSLSIAVRLGAAMVAGAVIGIDRELKNKPAGLRTHSMVSIGAAIVVLATVASSQGSADAASRAIQGIITGIGFLGAGVIMQYERERRVEGLTTAASIWVAAGLGVACGAGLVELVGIAMVAAILVLVGGNWIEGALGRRGESKLLDTPPDGDRRGK
ncbi:MAG TPA: MgtC/SapB family protein [Usitatibacter sp.]|nr:MgtC/SapB family protein [Usitatibacter sp.]